MNTYRKSIQKLYCNRCGRQQRPPTITIPDKSNAMSVGNTEARQSSPVSPLSPSPLFLDGAPGDMSQTAMAAGAWPQANRSATQTATQQRNNWPLVGDVPQTSGDADQPEKQSRSLALREAIMRPFSRQKTKRTSDSIKPFVPKKHAGLGDLNPSKIMTKISNTIRRKNTIRPRTADALLDRPGSQSKFSFVDHPTEEDTFEMNAFRNSDQIFDHDDVLVHAATIPEIIIQTDTIDNSMSRPEMTLTETSQATISRASLAEPLDPVAEDGDRADAHLSLSTPRPGISRFKSMRESAGRAAAVTRTSSIRRLNSVKKAPSLWYRDDMAIEGAIGVY